MSKNTIEFGGSDEAAIEYIRSRGYASYSSLKLVRDKSAPSDFKGSAATIFGGELHSRFLEGIQLQELTEAEEKVMSRMISNLKDNNIVSALMRGSEFEQKFEQPLRGVNVLGYIDILNSKDRHVSDLKTTSTTTLKSFVAQQDFLQAALYTDVTGYKDFFYIGISKVAPYNVFICNPVREYPELFKAKKKELVTLLKYLKSKL